MKHLINSVVVIACASVVTLVGCTQTETVEKPSVPVADNDSSADDDKTPQTTENKTDDKTKDDNMADSNSTNSESQVAADAPKTDETADASETKVATFGAGCFWCVEAVFDRLEGVKSVTSGYTGGEVENPTYEQVCSGLTGHAEVIQIEFDPAKISYDKLLEVFWKTHDPTTLNRQGADVGTQYRSAVFYHDEEQLKIASKYKKRLNDENTFGKPVVTTMEEMGVFYPAENYHQDYFKLKGNTNPYCQAVIPPKISKLHKVFGDLVKDEFKNER